MPDCSPRDLHAFKCHIKESKEGVCYSINANRDELGECSAPETFDYFARSDIWFISTITGLVLYVLACFFLQIFLVRSRRRCLSSNQKKVQSARVSLPIDDSHTLSKLGKFSVE